MDALHDASGKRIRKGEMMADPKKEKEIALALFRDIKFQLQYYSEQLKDITDRKIPVMENLIKKMGE